MFRSGNQASTPTWRANKPRYVSSRSAVPADTWHLDNGGEHQRHALSCAPLTRPYYGRREDDTSMQKDNLKYYTDLAKLAERGKVSSIFFADWFVGFDVYGGSLDTCLRAGHQVAHLDPSTVISAMAAVTDSVAFAVTKVNRTFPPSVGDVGITLT